VTPAERNLHDIVNSFGPKTEYEDVVCGICAGRGKVADGYRGSELDVPCPGCAGKGSIVMEKQR
jgi:DnaJ-class molecular chaperone